MKKILIVDNNAKYLEILFNNLNKELDIIKICSNGKEALKYILNENIDIILLELNIPKIKGIEILKKMEMNNIKSNVIIMSENLDLILEVLKNRLNFYHVFVKPFKTEELINTLKNIVLILESRKKSNKLTSLLNNFYFNKSSLGYVYLLDCLNLCIKQNITYISKIREIYKNVEVTNNNDVTTSQVEWNISKSIRTMKNLTNKEILNKYFPYNPSPSPKEFINGILYIYYNLYF